MYALIFAGPVLFLSTLSLRRATRRKENNYIDYCDFYPRSPCGERRDVIAVMTDAQSISIHALLAESDRAESDQRHSPDNFYPRSPCGERHWPTKRRLKSLKISIHALLAESD